MINLLPPTEKKRLENIALMKTIFHFGFLIILFLTSLLSFLFLILFSLETEAFKLKNSFESQKIFFDKKMSQELLEKNELLKKIFTFEKEKRETLPFLEKVLKELPEGISLESFFLEVGKDGKIKIFLSGKAEKREDLVKLKSFLEENFTQVFFPTGVWLKEKEIDFLVNFKEK